MGNLGNKQKNKKRFLATALTIAMSASLLSTGFVAEEKAAKAATVEIKEDFNNYSDANAKKGFTFGNPTLTLSKDGVDKTKALQVSDRKENYFGYAFDVTQFAGNTIELSAKLSAYEAKDGASTSFSATMKTSKTGADDEYKQVASATAKGKDFVTMTGTYEVPAGCDSYNIYFETEKEVSYLIDDISITVKGDYNKPGESTYADISKYPVLKDLYKDSFKIGVASEALSHWGGSNPLSEIGNKDKEALILKEFNSLTFGNELKPAYNMGYTSKEATETNLPFVIDTSAKEMLDWAKANKMPVRGHVLVWHSQCSDEVFCKDYKPVYKDAAKTQLDPSCFVSRDVMLARLESYINSVMDYMYKNGYGNVIYAWDVVNEAVEPGTNQYNLRDSYWYKTIGSDFIYYSFKYARAAVEASSKKYASTYGVDAANATALKSIQPKLFYNDYNEFQAEKCTAIIDILTKQYNNHSVKGEGLIDGIGMQGHLSDTTDIDTFVTALRRYNAAFGEVQITELDVTQTSTGVNAEYYQAAFYKKFFEALIKEQKSGVNLTSVTIWGLTDDNSWKKEGLPLLFKADLSTKMAFDGIVNAKTGKALPEPTFVAPDFSDITMSFETADNVEGMTPRGDGSLAVQNKVTYDGKGALVDTGRTANWNGAAFDVSKYIGQTIAISAWVKCADTTVKISADIDGVWPNIASATSKGQWVQIKGTYKVPADLTALKLYFESDATSDLYIDQVKVKLVGLDEDFEGSTNIASARGVGHMPVVAVTDKESHNKGGHSFFVKREAQDATMKFDVSKYIGQTVEVKAFVKTNDSKITMGFDGDKPTKLAEVKTKKGQWTEIKTTVAISNVLTSANIYIETDGRADFYVDDISVRIADYVDDVEGNLNFTPRWSGAGEVAKVEDGKKNHAAVITKRGANYEGIAFDVSAFLGMEVEISLDVKTTDKKINLTGDINDVWPNYLSTVSKPGQYTKVSTIVTLPKDLTALKLYVETEGTADIYVDNLKIRRVEIGEEKAKKPETTSNSITRDLSKGDSAILKADDLKKLLENGDAEIAVIGKDGKELCTWKFDAKQLKKKTKLKDIDLAITTESAKSIGYENGMIITMNQKGKLPIQAKVTVKVDSVFKADSKVYLYRVDAKKNKLNCVPNASYKVDQSGYVTLNVNAGEKYVLLPNTAKNKDKVFISKQVKPVGKVTVKKGKLAPVAPKLPDTCVKVTTFTDFDKAQNKAVYGVVVTYESSNDKVATVSKYGNVTGKGKGKAKITVTVEFSNGATTSYTTTVTVK